MVPWHKIMDQALITGRGYYKMGSRRGVVSEVLPLQKGRGANKVLAMLKRGTMR